MTKAKRKPQTDPAVERKRQAWREHQAKMQAEQKQAQRKTRRRTP
jgi:hypothetical protein